MCQSMCVQGESSADAKKKTERIISILSGKQASCGCKSKEGKKQNEKVAVVKILGKQVYQ